MKKLKRTKYPNDVTKETFLAVAHPNKQYIFYRNIENVTFKAVHKAGKIFFYEVDPTILTGERRRSEEFVRQFFNLDSTIKNRPFTKKGNEDFYAVLFRKKKSQKPRFERILKKSL